jgi:hypothetical protein
MSTIPAAKDWTVLSAAVTRESPTHGPFRFRFVSFGRVVEKYNVVCLPAHEESSRLPVNRGVPWSQPSAY